MHIAANVARVLSVATIALACVAAPAASQQDDSSETIASDGTKLRIIRSGATESPASAGQGRVLRFGETDDALATPRTRLQILDDERRLARAKPARDRPPAESIIGPDTRTRVTPTTVVPARYTVLVLFSDGFGGDFLCSGFLINKNTVATAGHCVAPGTAGGYYPVNSYRIFPGRNGVQRPYGSCGARALYSVGRWVNLGRDDFDYGAIKLDCNIGNTTGWFGYAANSGPVGTAITTQGYPGDKPLGQQWKAIGKVTAQQTRRTFYKNDTAGGMSGSPVWFGKNVPGCRVCAIAIHAYGTGGTGIYATNNHGTRINQEVFDNLTTWKNVP